MIVKTLVTVNLLKEVIRVFGNFVGLTKAGANALLSCLDGLNWKSVYQKLYKADGAGRGIRTPVTALQVRC